LILLQSCSNVQHRTALPRLLYPPSMRPLSWRDAALSLSFLPDEYKCEEQPGSHADAFLGINTVNISSVCKAFWPVLDGQFRPFKQAWWQGGGSGGMCRHAASRCRPVLR
jgi:hypothetical protein